MKTPEISIPAISQRSDEAQDRYNRRSQTDRVHIDFLLKRREQRLSTLKPQQLSSESNSPVPIDKTPSKLISDLPYRPLRYPFQETPRVAEFSGEADGSDEVLLHVSLCHSIVID